MSPVSQFEVTARRLWRADLPPAEKGAKLMTVRSAIVRYVDRLDEKRDAEQDPWTARSYDRVRGYLVHLASDVENLSLECERTSAPARTRVASLFTD